MGFLEVDNCVVVFEHVDFIDVGQLLNTCIMAKMVLTELFDSGLELLIFFDVMGCNYLLGSSLGA